jgi:DNA polymerase/3'-5' exonuclease PolX
MSEGPRHQFHQAWHDAEDLRALFVGCYERWEFAGSLRRRSQSVGDVEHVILPAFRGPARVEGLFGAQEQGGERVNLLWERADELLRMGIIAKGVYSDGGTKWGPKLHGVGYRGILHEFFTADQDNWGSQLVIKTGPWDFAKAMVTRLRAGGIYVQDEGYVRYAGGPSVGQVRAVATEEEYFTLCGVTYVAPQLRAGLRAGEI